mgnify:CR=1 FL=1
MERKTLEGTLEEINIEYKNGKFNHSKIYISPNGITRESFFFEVPIPEFLLGKKVIYFQEYFKEGFVEHDIKMPNFKFQMSNKCQMINVKNMRF